MTPGTIYDDFFLFLVFCLPLFYKKFTTCLLVVAGTFFLEYVGVATGLLFGEYAYGEGLFSVYGVALFVPFARLFLLTHVVTLSKNVLNAVLAIVIIDIPLELFATFFDLWTRTDPSILGAPIQNYGIRGLVMVFIYPYLSQKEGYRFSKEYSLFSLAPVLFFIISVLVLSIL